jgi:Fe-S cluster assembly protein SufD
MKQSAFSIEELRKTVSSLPNDALSTARDAALVNLEKNGLPTTKHEDWKYTDLGQVIDISNRWLASGATITSSKSINESIVKLTKSIDANWLVISNGLVDTTRFDENAGIKVDRFSESSVPLTMDRPLADLNAALLQDGLRIQIHSATEKPLGLLVIDEVNDDASVSQVNIQIEMAPGCDAEVIEYHFSLGSGDHYSNSIISLCVGEAAIAQYVRIQNRRIGHVQTGQVSVALRKNGKLKMASYDVGGGLVRNDINIDLSEPGADANLNGLYLAGDEQHIDNHIQIDHSVGPASSSQEYRGILNGSSRCVWNGKTFVHKGADGTDANQGNHNLLLSENAEINTKPELEIYADDVKCSHGTTVGQLDQAALFYLRTRGLSIKQAMEVLTYAFATDLVDCTPVSSTRDVISSLVESRLTKLIMDQAS